MRLRALILTAAVAASAQAQQGHVIQTIAGGGPNGLPKLEADLNGLIAGDVGSDGAPR